MTETTSPATPTRPRPLLLVLLAVVLAGAIVYLLWPAAAGPAAPSNASREQRKQASAAAGTTGPASLAVDLDALKQVPPSPAGTSRNPFRFYVPPPPPPPPPPPRAGRSSATPGFEPARPSGPPPLPAIPLKFIGIVEQRGRKVAIFVSSDGKGMPVYAAEGEIVLGQYRVVRIGVESVTVEYLDGRGRQTIPMRG
jgi:hypothetical protein